MGSVAMDRAIELLEEANAELRPQLLSASEARALLEAYARAQRLAAYGVAVLGARLDDASELARSTGTSLGKAKDAVATGKVLEASDELSEALRQGEVSLEQATEIAGAERSVPGAAADLLATARDRAFHVLKEEARRVVLEAQQHEGLAGRQRAARRARSYLDGLGMVHVDLAFEPQVGTPIVNRAQAEAARLVREAKKEGDGAEPFERHLADAYAAMLSGGGTGRARRPELVVLVSHEVAKRGWRDVGEGEVCKIPGVGPVAPGVAREIARDAFLTGVFYDGKDLRHLRRWTRHTPVEVLLALELGGPPAFDGIRCADCGNRFGTQIDHVEPHCALGPASTDNLQPRCWSCHQAKTAQDRRAGKLGPPDT